MTSEDVETIHYWTPMAQAGYFGMAPLATSRSSLLVRPSTRDNDRRVVLNISGRKFETWETTLEKYPETLLGGKGKDSFYDKEKQEYFFDRDPVFFRHVLNYYRKGKLHFSLEECGKFYKEELKFFKISPDNVDLCCFEEFEESVSLNFRKPRPPGESRCDCSVQKVRKSLRQRVWDLFENPYNSSLGKITYAVTGIAIIVSILTTITETIPCSTTRTCGELHASAFFIVDGVCVGIFTLEYLVRLLSAPERWPFVKNFQSIIDVASVMPFYLDILFEQISGGSSGAEGLTILRVFRVFRVVKMSRHSKRLQSLGASIKNSSSELGFILFSFSLGVVIFATVIYYCEKDELNTSFLSIPDGMWYAIVTMTTTGYGDMTPETAIGQLMGSFCCIVGTLVIALPVPIL
ncbi:predicted protein, partial [Nematostella vectensis]